MTAFDLYTDLTKIFEEYDERIRELTHDKDMSIDKFNELINERNQLTLLDVRHHVLEFHESIFGKKTN